MKIKQIDDDPKKLAIVFHKASDGWCRVANIIKDKPLILSHEYMIHKIHLDTPDHMKPRPRRIKFIDPLETMKKDSNLFFGFGQVATLQRREQRQRRK